MDSISEFADERHKGMCLHCGSGLQSHAVSRDHVPSKCCLTEPFPENLPVIHICAACNNGFSADEEYLAAFVGCVLVGSTDPSLQRIPSAGRILSRNEALRARIERAKNAFTTRGGQQRIVWNPEIERISRIVVKNARGHALFELGEAILHAPARIWSAPLETLSPHDRDEFERTPAASVWPEVGSRMMTRMLTEQDLENGWVVVQDGIYRYCAAHEDGILIRSVLFEYLATEVRWES